MRNKKLLQDLLAIQAVAGEELYIFKFIKEKLKKENILFTELDHGDIVVGKKCPKVLFSAHVDEIGFQITKVASNGRCRIKGIGWVYPWLFPGRDVQVMTADGNIHYGVVVYHDAFSKNINKWNQIDIDFGYDSIEELEAIGIRPGVFGTYKKMYWETPNRIFATSFDNRLSVWLLLNCISKYKKEIMNGMISFAFTSDEEVENIGAKKTIPWVNPEYVCVVDIMPHSLLETAVKLDISDGPYILNKTLDYTLPSGWKLILSDIPFVPINGKSEYLKDSEPKMFQKKGFIESINLMTIVENYHHGTYALHRSAIHKTEEALRKIIKTIRQ